MGADRLVELGRLAGQLDEERKRETALASDADTAIATLAAEMETLAARLAEGDSRQSQLVLALGKAEEDNRAAEAALAGLLTKEAALRAERQVALASLNAIVDVTGLNLPNDDLVMRARANQQAIAAEVEGNDDARAVVAALEQQYDTYLEGRQRPSLLATEASQLPSADELGEDFENFLRAVNDDEQA